MYVCVVVLYVCLVCFVFPVDACAKLARNAAAKVLLPFNLFLANAFVMAFEYHKNDVPYIYARD